MILWCSSCAPSTFLSFCPVQLPSQRPMPLLHEHNRDCYCLFQPITTTSLVAATATARRRGGHRWPNLCYPLQLPTSHHAPNALPRGALLPGKRNRLPALGASLRGGRVGMWVPLLMSHPFGKDWFQQTPRSHKDDSVGTHPRGTDSAWHSYLRAHGGVGWQAWDAGLLPAV